VFLLSKTIHGIEDLAHERPASRDHGTNKHHFASQSLKIVFAHRFTSFDSSHLVENVLDALGIHADGHVHGVNNESENFHNLGWEESLCF